MLTGPRQGLLFVVSAPSGAGKTTLVRAVLSLWPDLRYSVSCTTRPPRAGEIPGQDYHFLSRKEFVDGIRTDRFVEWAEVHGQYYGTDGEQIEAWLEAGNDVLLDIDVQGASQIRCSYPMAHTIFVIPPSLHVLEERLKNRGTESPEQLAGRLAAAKGELQEAPWYDYIVVNDILDEAIADFNALLRACHCKSVYRAARLKPFVLPDRPSR